MIFKQAAGPNNRWDTFENDEPRAGRPEVECGAAIGSGVKVHLGANVCVPFQSEPAAPARRLAQQWFSPQQRAQQTSCSTAALKIPLHHSQAVQML